jgi:hypothetical protein
MRLEDSRDRSRADDSQNSFVPEKPLFDLLNNSDRDRDARATQTKETKSGIETRFLEFESLFPAVENEPKPAAKTTTETRSPDGGTWRKQTDGSWSYTDVSGKQNERFKDAKITDVVRADDGSVTLKYADKTSLTQKADKSEIVLDAQGKVASRH